MSNSVNLFDFRITGDFAKDGKTSMQKDKE